MSLSGALHLTILVLPLLALTRRPLSRRAALYTGAATFGLASLLLLMFTGPTVTLAWSGTDVLLLDDLSVWLMPYTAIIYLAILLCTPRANRQPGEAERLLLGLSIDLTFFSVHSTQGLALLWPLTHLPLYWELRRCEKTRLLRILGFFLIPGCLLFMLGGMTCALSVPGHVPLWAFIALTLGIVLRKAIIPVHQWLPELFEEGPLGHVIAFCTPQVGAFATLRILVPEAPENLLVALGAAALVTSVYGACLACGTRSVRRTFAGLFVAQTSLVFAGLQCATNAGLAGGLALWISGGLALTGFGLTIWALEARRGRITLDSYQGGYDQSPILANCFLILGLSSIGFPGTLGFIAEELLLEGTTHIHPHVGILAAVATTLNGITIMRAYMCMFCGARREVTRSQSLRPRERVAMLTLVALLLGFGFVPQPFVASCWKAGHTALTVRRATLGLPPH